MPGQGHRAPSWVELPVHQGQLHGGLPVEQGVPNRQTVHIGEQNPRTQPRASPTPHSGTPSGGEPRPVVNATTDGQPADRSPGAGDAGDTPGQEVHDRERSVSSAQGGRATGGRWSRWAPAARSSRERNSPMGPVHTGSRIHAGALINAPHRGPSTPAPGTASGRRGLYILIGHEMAACPSPTPKSDGAGKGSASMTWKRRVG
jgi:hypothetical protein